MNDILKPCPFCGGEVDLFMDNYRKYGASCKKCHIYLGIELESGVVIRDGWRATINSEKELREMWNCRYHED